MVTFKSRTSDVGIRIYADCSSSVSGGVVIECGVCNCKCGSPALTSEEVAVVAAVGVVV